jgi:CMP/dCMP kinase
MKHLQIAIDGPSGAGKSTVARHVAKTLGILYLDTGAMYRAVALKVIRRGIRLADSDAVSAMMKDIRIDVVHRDDGQHILLDGEDVSPDIRSTEVSMGASAVSAYPAVRERLVSLQREIAGRSCVVMDGRDIGTKVLPDADVKIFLTASPEVRARRRFLELQENGLLDKPYEALLDEILTRDRNDSNRAHSPLVKAEDAVLLDTTGYTLVEASDAVMAVIEARKE